MSEKMLNNSFKKKKKKKHNIKPRSVQVSGDITLHDRFSRRVNRNLNKAWVSHWVNRERRHGGVWILNTNEEDLASLDTPI